VGKRINAARPTKPGDMTKKMTLMMTTHDLLMGTGRTAINNNDNKRKMNIITETQTQTEKTERKIWREVEI